MKGLDTLPKSRAVPGYKKNMPPHFYSNQQTLEAAWIKNLFFENQIYSVQFCIYQTLHGVNV